MKKYELLLVLPGTLDENETAQKTGEVLGIVNEFGQNAEIKPLGKNRLAYPIKQVRYGYFYNAIFEAEPENVKKIEEKLRLTRGVLRSIVYLYNKALEGAEKISYFSQTSTLAEPEAVRSEETVMPAAEIPAQTSGVMADEKESIKETPMPAQEKKPRSPRVKEQKIDLEELDKKLDEILSDEDINI